MDIAEIRKKAKAGRDAGVAAAAAPLAPQPPPPIVEAKTGVAPQVLPAAPAVVAAPVVPAPAVIEMVAAATITGSGAMPASSPVDPLDALFNWNPEFSLATEAGYQQGLEHRDEEDARRWLTFSLGTEDYALDITRIREIIKPREITEIPRVPDFLLGIISLRGSIIPVFDLRNRLKLGKGVITPESRIIVCHQGQRGAGLLVDRISQVVTLPAGRIEPPPAILSGIDRDLVEGVGRHQGKMMILLQLASVLDAELT
ncbi:MAG: hypothetical protein A2091_10050 [Desulfuromonadales bacterium GWD2_61_12]|nr:MAG: hypothetical protein A2005_12695 [Desulfuromonadales bacterium GWC2_61_20]OGR33731.1 MAG: hypothetical protein A2091_10050 [Desulfuromonadales bacterium GWD2_61_12]HAD05386.1 chemotaxis protein CheW [Desulfuromonas sp.]